MPARDIFHKAEVYRQIIRDVMREYAQYRPASGDIELETVFDAESDHYELLAVGWRGKQRVHGCVIHADIRDDKVWLQHDSTDAAIADQLVERGIPAEDIVLGFQPEHIRHYSGFAVQ